MSDQRSEGGCEKHLVHKFVCWICARLQLLWGTLNKRMHPQLCVCVCQRSQVHDTCVFCPHLSQAHVAFFDREANSRSCTGRLFLLLLRSRPMRCARKFFVRDKRTTFYHSAKSMETFGNLSLQELRRKRPLLQRAFRVKPQPKIFFTVGF